MHIIKQKIRNYYILSVTINIALTVFGAISYMFLIKSGFNFSQIGIYLSVFWLSSMVFEIPTGILVDIYKHKKTLLLANVIRIIGILMLAFNHDSMFLILISAILTGFAEAILSGNLVSWIVNEINKSKEEIKLNIVFSRGQTLCTIFGLFSGYIGSDFLFKINMKLPFIISCAFLFMFSILIIFMLEDEKQNVINYNPFKTRYATVIKEIIFMIKRKELYYFLTFYLIINLINLGPSNQWQEIYKNIEFLSLGEIWILIGISSIIGSYLPSKFNIEKISTKIGLLLILLIDIFIVLVQSISKKYIPLFFLHIIIYAIITLVINTYKHIKVIKNDTIRATATSVINTFDSLGMTLLLSISGHLSTKYGVLISWKIFLIVAFLCLILLVLWKEPNYDKK